jgi:glycosyltransferase involved in cell wall biosynthesis
VASLDGLTLAICTRNRHEDVKRCVASVAAQTPDYPVEVMVVDDGGMPEEILSELERLLAAGNFATFTYFRKQQPGLLLSRMFAVERARYDTLLFVDDDAELERDYLVRLADAYKRHPKAAAIGGIDPNVRGNWKWNLFTRLILYDSGHPGKLSPSGYGGSMVRWSTMSQPFRTEYLLGCNMSFRREALRGIAPVAWLEGYSLGEDLYLSDLAGRHGELWIDPALRVIHHASPISRDREELVAYTEIVNHHHLLRLKQAGPARHAALLWTALGLFCRALLRNKWRHKAASYRKAIRVILAEDWGISRS